MSKNKALFLDRDGVINENTGYLYLSKDVRWVNGVFELMRRFQTHGYLLIIITNQSGIGRGYYTESDFWTLTKWMQEYLLEQNIKIDDVWFCPHHPEHAKGKYLQQCTNRKPAPGMLLSAIEKWNVDPAASAMIGDSWSDVQAAKNAKLGTCYYYSKGMTPEQKHYANTVNTDIHLAKTLRGISC